MKATTKMMWLPVHALVIASAAWAQQVRPAPPPNPHATVLLWPSGAPGSEGKTAPELVTDVGEGEHRVSSINAPSIAPYLVRNAKAPTAAVIIAPGGGHQFLSIEMEGYDVARYLAAHGVAAFVLKYRLAREQGSTYTVEGDELNDMQRAIRLVRSRAAEWNIDPTRVGVMGFSAGGELALLAMTRFHDPAHGDEAAVNGVRRTDAVDRESDKPAFEALMYPGGLTAPQVAAASGPRSPAASAAALPLKPEIISRLNKDTPPAFLLCGAEDRPEIAQALPQLFVAMKRAGVSAELHEYAGVGHGFGLRFSQNGPVAEWPALFVDWLDTKGLLRK